MNTPTADALLSSIQPLHATHVQLLNESHQHAGFFEGKESHFKLVVVSEQFADKRLAARHQLIYQLVSHLLTANGGTVHALAIYAYTPDEWQTEQSAPDSPVCASRRK